MPQGTTPIPTFIEQSARGKMRLENGLVYIKFVNVKHRYYGARGALARILGWYDPSKKDTQGRLSYNMRIYNATDRGSRPKDAKLAKLLEKLAGPDGHRLAVRELTKLGVIDKYPGPSRAQQLQQEDKE